MQNSRLSDIQTKVDRLAQFMDDCIKVPGTNFRFGWDVILGLLPGVGDLVTVIPQFYLVAQALRVGVRKRTFVFMLINVLVDFLVGVIPGVGDLFDAFWKSNLRNAELLRSEIRRQCEVTDTIDVGFKRTVDTAKS